MEPENNSCGSADEKKNHVRYIRRLDRTPDKGFDLFAEKDQVQLSSFRSALEKAKSRIMSLRDENDVKDFIIDEERKLRKVTENNLKCLVDMYCNPVVNIELQSRLPSAKKVYPVHSGPDFSTSSAQRSGYFNERINVVRDQDTTNDVKLTETSNKVEAANKIENSFPGTCDVVVNGFLQPMAQASGGHLEASINAPHVNSQPCQTPREGNLKMDEDHFPNRLQRKSHSTPILDVSQNPQVYPTLMSISQILPPYINSSMFPNQLSSASCSSLESSVYQSLPQVHGQKDQRVTDLEPRLKTDDKQHTLSSTETQTMSENLRLQSNFVLPQPSLFSTHPTYSHYVGSHGPSQHPSCLPDKSGTFYSVPDNVSQTSRLLVEIATLKIENEELRRKLGDAKNEIKLLEISKNPTNDQNLDKVGALIEELHNAEKKRSLALSVLNGIADDEKTEACDKPSKKYGSKSVQTEISFDCEFSGAKDFNDGMTDTSESSSEDAAGINRKKPYRQKHLEELLTRQREEMKEEMHKVLEERNEARQRVLKLEKRLATLELSCFTDNNSCNSLLAKLRVTERERDIAVAKLQYLARDVDETKLIYNLHKALLSDDPTNRTPSYSVPKISNLDFDLAKKNTMTSVSKEMKEKAKMGARIVLVKKQKQSQAEHIEKLEELVKRQ